VAELVIHENRCTDCRACELACSYHFTRAFNSSISAVHVRRLFQQGEVKITVHKTREGERRACDLCSGERVALCARYCATRAIEFRR